MKTNKTLFEQQYEYYKRENDTVKWTAILLFGVPAAMVFIIGFMLIFGA